MKNDDFWVENMTTVQVRVFKFLVDEFELCEAVINEFSGLPPQHLWTIREDCISIECDESMADIHSSTIRGKTAASVVDIISSMLPPEWKRKTPPEVEAMFPELKAGSMCRKPAEYEHVKKAV